jgi:hypothetical protein
MNGPHKLEAKWYGDIFIITVAKSNGEILKQIALSRKEAKIVCEALALKGAK